MALPRAKERGVDPDNSQQEYGFVTAIFVLEHTSEKLSPGEAESVFSAVAKENFWRVWPQVRDWVESFWQRLEDERHITSKPVEDNEWDDVGGGG
jgi:hypothetical protein